MSLVTPGFWGMFDIRPVVGRFFSEAEDRPPAGTAVAVLGYGYWQSAYGGERSALGRSVFIGARPYTIIGVAPRGFEGLSLRQVSLFIERRNDDADCRQFHESSSFHATIRAPEDVL